MIPDCQKLQVILKNDVLSKQGSHQGTYQINKIVNGRLSWKSVTNAIWYCPADNSWSIGSLDLIGSIHCGIALWAGEGVKTPDQVPDETWKYFADGGCFHPGLSGDVVINSVQGKAQSVH